MYFFMHFGNDEKNKAVRLRFKIKQNRILHRVVFGENDVLLEIIIGIYLQNGKFNTFISVCMRANEDGTETQKKKQIDSLDQMFN